ncbi:MAG: WD40/YVTN/BNR-like repeat-containing protein [Candidatus Binataceae bacterium]
MAHEFTLCVGTVGAGVWYSADGGERWRRSAMKLPFYAEPGEIQIRSLAVSPHNPHHVLAGSEAGLYRSEDNGMSWDLIESPMAGMQIWSAAWHPADPGVIFAGTKPPGVFRTVDGGQRWEKLPIDIVEKCFAGAPKVTNIVFDPRAPKNVWVSVEIDGVFRSRDGGDTWTHLPALGSKVINQDMHGLALSLGNPVKLLATTPDGIWSSIDEGESWSLHGFPRFAERDQISYCRGVAVKPDDPDTIFVANGDFIPGKRGAIHRTRDGGKTWDKMALPVEPNSTIYWFATNRANPDIIAANSLHGYLYLSTDAGDSWTKLRREFGEIRALAWLPN